MSQSPTTPSRTAGAAAEPPSFEFDAFLSYATRGNYLLCRRVEAFLESFHHRVAQGGERLKPLHVCRDGSDFRQWLSVPQEPLTDPVWARIEGALRRSRRLVVLCSPETAASAWVNREIAWMLEERGPDDVWLAMAAGDDPATRPEGIVPPAAIAAELHKRQIWYDLRQWRGQRGDRIRNAEDELVRLAVDLLDLPADRQQGLAAVWQRESSRAARRQAGIAWAAAAAVVVGAGVAGWQFVAARNRALQAQAASEVRVTEAALDRSPLLGALVAQEWNTEHAPVDALGIGWRLLGSEVPQARIRGHERGIVGAGWTADGRVWAADRDGVVSVAPADGRGNAMRLQLQGFGAAVVAHSSPDRSSLWLASKQGGVRQVRISAEGLVESGIGCRLPAEDVRYLWVAAGTPALLLAGYKEQAYWCLPAANGQVRTLPVAGRVVQSWFDTERAAWQLVTDLGRLWQVNAGGAGAKELPQPVLQGGGGAASREVKAVAVVPGRWLALSNAEGLWLGRPRGDSWALRHVEKVGAISALAFSPDGERLAVADAATGQVVILRCADGDRLTELDHRAQMFTDPSSADTFADRPSAPEAFSVGRLSWSPNGRVLATLQAGLSIRLWAVGAGDAAAPRRLRGHPGAEGLTWSPDGSLLLSAGDDGDLLVWPRDGVLQNARVALRHRLYAAALAPKRRLLALLNQDDALLLANADRLTEPLTIMPRPPGCERPSGQDQRLPPGLAFDARERLWWLRRDGGISLLPDLVLGGAQQTGNPAVTWCTQATVASLVPGWPGVVLVDAQRHLVKLLDTGPQVLDEAVPEAVVQIAASPGGRWLAVATRAGEVVRWDTASGTPPKRTAWRAHRGPVMCLAVDEASGGVLSTGEDGQAVWQPAHGEALRWTGDGGWMEQCAVRDGIGFAAAQSGRLWKLDLGGGKPPQGFEGRDGVAHIGSLNQLLQLPGRGGVLTGGGIDGQASVWDGEQRRRTATAFMGGAVTGFVLDDARKRVIAIGEGGRVSALPLTIDAVQAELARATSANLTPAERVDMLGEPASTSCERYAEGERKRSRQSLPCVWRFKMPF